jgi:CheY-like chemotaxis protein
VLQGAVDAVRPAAEAKGIRITIATDPGGEAVKGDPERLQQVLWNLLMNAVKFTPRGGSVHVHLDRVGSNMQIRVVDTGQGMSADVLPQVFERFRQGDASSTRRHGGLGLGLTLVKHLVEMHGGTVTAESAGANQGSTFTVTLPVALAGSVTRPPLQRRTESIPDSSAPLVRLDGLRVLLVDDDPEGAAVGDAILRTAGAVVECRSSAAAALALLRDWRPDVLVSDIEMPERDGYTLIRELRALPPDAGGETPAIALTAYGRPQDRARSIEAGYEMHVPKPVDPGELTALIAALAARGRRPPAVPERV